MQFHRDPLQSRQHPTFVRADLTSGVNVDSPQLKEHSLGSKSEYWCGKVPMRRMLLLGFMIALLITGNHYVLSNWPFRYRKVIPLLEDTFDSQVQVHSFHRFYFPHPGFAAGGVVFRRAGEKSGPPLATIEHMRMEGTWHNLLHPHELHLVRLDGLRVHIPARIRASRQYADGRIGEGEDGSRQHRGGQHRRGW